MNKRICEACHGRGVLVPAQPSCRINDIREYWLVVERCDTCEHFRNDLDAALSLFEIAGWFQCHSGGMHALADGRTQITA